MIGTLKVGLNDSKNLHLHASFDKLFLLTNPQLLFGKGITDLVFEKYQFEEGHELADLDFSGTNHCILDFQKPSKRHQYPKKEYGLGGNRDWQYIPWRDLETLEALDLKRD